MTSHKTRRRRLLRNTFQLRLVGSFVGLAAVALLLQFLLLALRVNQEASHMQGAGGEMARQTPGILLQVLAFTMAVLLPIVFAFGVLLTFRIAGPVVRFQAYLTSVVEGREIEPCKIRTDDDLQELCELINRATEAARKQNAAAQAGQTEAPDRRAA